jgi:hypothetical protein
MTSQRRWQRIVLLAVLIYEGLGGLVGGSLLMARPDGRLMDMPVGIMHGTFRDFLIPGAILFALGLLGVGAFFAVLRRFRADWIWAGLSLGGWAVWFFVEIVILRELHWLHVMWGFPVILGGLVALPLLPFRPATMRDTWLVCGVLSSLLYVAMNVITSAQWPAYDSASQTVSELSAVGAPTRAVWVAMAMIYTLLVTGFGWGLRMSAGENRRLRVVGVLVVIYGALGLVWPFAPMHLRDALAAGDGDLRDTFHLALAGVTVSLYLVSLGIAATALGRGFRLYSGASFVALLAFAALTSREAPHVGKAMPTPHIGIWERANIGVFLLWVIVLAVERLYSSRRAAAPRAAKPPSNQATRTRSAVECAPSLA